MNKKMDIEDTKFCIKILFLCIGFVICMFAIGEYVTFKILGYYMYG